MEELKEAIEETGVPMIGWIPYDETVTNTMRKENPSLNFLQVLRW